jgi:hypothetical protein
MWETTVRVALKFGLYNFKASKWMAGQIQEVPAVNLQTCVLQQCWSVPFIT